MMLELSFRSLSYRIYFDNLIIPYFLWSSRYLFPSHLLYTKLLYNKIWYDDDIFSLFPFLRFSLSYKFLHISFQFCMIFSRFTCWIFVIYTGHIFIFRTKKRFVQSSFSMKKFIFFTVLSLFLVLDSHHVRAAPRALLVKSLPGFVGSFPSNHYAGYVILSFKPCTLLYM